MCRIEWIRQPDLSVKKIFLLTYGTEDTTCLGGVFCRFNDGDDGGGSHDGRQKRCRPGLRKFRLLFPALRSRGRYRGHGTAAAGCS